MTSVLNVDTIADKAGTGPVGLTKQTAAKGFILQRNNSTAFATLNSFNISATTDNANGDTTFTLTNAMSDANFVVLCTPGNDSGTDKHMLSIGQSGGSQLSTTTCRSLTRDISSSSATGNIESQAQATFGDLA